MNKKTWKQIVREELEKLAPMTWKERLDHIITYYKLLFAILLAVIVVIYTGVSIYHNKNLNYILQAYMINASSITINTEQISDEFAEYIGGIEKNDEIMVDATMIVKENDTSSYSLAGQIKIATYTSAGDVDLMILDRAQFEVYQKQGYFADLETVFSEEQLERWSDRLVYRDIPSYNPETELMDEKTGDVTAVQTVGTETEEDPLSAEPQKEEGQKCYGMRIEDAQVLQRYSAYSGEAAYAAVMVNAKHPERCGQFCEYLFEPDPSDP